MLLKLTIVIVPDQSSSIKIAVKKAPAVSPYFVLRSKEWDKLVWHLVTSPSPRQRILPITGMGGCGKTQLISYFLQEYPSLFKHVVYVDASTLSSIEADLQAWAKALGDGHEHDTWEDAVRILAGIPGEERWGLILDNADDPSLSLDPVLPKNANLTVIITSRNRNLGNLSTTYHMELGEMEPEEALATFLRAARRQLPLPAEEQKSANALLKELGCLAVALVQAGTYCRELSHSFTQYLTLFYSHRAELMKKAEPSSLDNYQRGAYTTLDLSYNALPQKSRDFLHFLSFFHHTDIPLSALSTAARENFEDPDSYLPRTEDHASVITGLEKLLCVNGSWSEIRVQEILCTLRSFSLLSISSIEDSVLLRLHPLIQAWSRDMDPSTSPHHRAMALQVLTACDRDDAFRLRAQLLPHVFDMLNQLNSQDMHVNDLMAAGRTFRMQGQYRAAEELFKTALEVVGQTTKNQEKLIGTISEWLAVVYQHEGRWRDAETLDVDVLEQRRTALGMEHPDTLRAVAGLASTYSNQGRRTTAEKLELEVLRRRRKILGLEHPDTLRAVAALASTYRNQGRWTKAEKLELEVLRRRRKILGLEHPDTIRAASDLAFTLHAQCRYSEAEKLRMQVLEQRRRILGLEHPKTIRAAINLAHTYRAQCQWTEAEKLELEVLQQHRRILGLEHPDTIYAAGNLVVTYCRQNRWEESAALLAQAVQLGLKVLGQSHPHTQIYTDLLLGMYEQLGKEKEAQEMRALVSPITDSQGVAGP